MEYSGQLLFKRKKDSKFKKRWACISETTKYVSIYKQKTDINPLILIPLTNASISLQNIDGRNSFVIQSQNSFCFSMEYVVGQGQWMMNIQEIISLNEDEKGLHCWKMNQFSISPNCQVCENKISTSAQFYECEICNDPVHLECLDIATNCRISKSIHSDANSKRVSSDFPRKTGFLKLQSGLIPKKRFFSLQNGTLSWFENNTTNKKKGELLLDECSAEVDTLMKRPFTLHLTHKKDHKYITAGSTDEMNEWLDAFISSGTVRIGAPPKQNNGAAIPKRVTPSPSSGSSLPTARPTTYMLGGQNTPPILAKAASSPNLHLQPNEKKVQQLNSGTRIVSFRKMKENPSQQDSEKVAKPTTSFKRKGTTPLAIEDLPKLAYPDTSDDVDDWDDLDFSDTGDSLFDSEADDTDEGDFEGESGEDLDDEQDVDDEREESEQTLEERLSKLNQLEENFDSFTEAAKNVPDKKSKDVGPNSGFQRPKKEFGFSPRGSVRPLPKGPPPKGAPPKRPSPKGPPPTTMAPSERPLPTVLAPLPTVPQGKDRALTASNPLSVVVSEAVTKAEGGSTFTVYEINCSWGENKWTIYRRFKQCYKLNVQLARSVIGKQTYSLFPSRKLRKKLSAKTIEQRKASLNSYFAALIKDYAVVQNFENPEWNKFIVPSQIGDTKEESFNLEEMIGQRG